MYLSRHPTILEIISTCNINTTAFAVMEMRESTDKIKHNECDTTVRVVRATISDKPNEVKLENGKRLNGESTIGTFRCY